MLESLTRQVLSDPCHCFWYAKLLIFIRAVSKNPYNVNRALAYYYVYGLNIFADIGKYVASVSDALIPYHYNVFKANFSIFKDTEDCFEDCCAGDACAVFVPEDDMWYRCIVHSRVEIDEEV